MNLPRRWLDRVDAARHISILEIADRLGLGEPRRSGSEWLVLCPLHADERPSLHLNAEKGCWYCFPCGEGGDGIGLVMRARRLGFADAVQELAP